LGLCWNW